MLGVGLVLVLALAIGLVRMTRGTTQAATPVGPRAAPQPVAEAPRASAPSTAPGVPSPGPVPAASRPQAAVAARRPELAPPPVSFAREPLKRDANGKLVPIITVKELREQFHRTDAAMNACLARSGQAPTGKATLSFTVGAKGNKLIIETTGVQDEETLVAYPELLDCMHRTANELVLDGRPVPELGTPIYVRRHVRLEGGVVAENTIFNFSYNP